MENREDLLRENGNNNQPKMSQKPKKRKENDKKEERVGYLLILLGFAFIIVPNPIVISLTKLVNPEALELLFPPLFVFIAGIISIIIGFVLLPSKD